MTESKKTPHTHGPWTVDGGLEYSLSAPEEMDNEACKVFCGEEREAKARLIAAAPDLLSALISAIPVIGCSLSDLKNEFGKDEVKPVQKIYDDAAAAIAKAKGSLS